MSDQICLTGLQFYGYHGVLPGEREVGQRFLVDVTLDCDISVAARTDNLENTINYAQVADMVAAVVTGPPRQLIETVVGQIADELVLLPGVQAAEVTIHKPSAPITHTFDDVAITTRRQQSECYQAVLSIGANLGDAREMVSETIDSYAQDPAYELVAASPIYRTPAWGGVEQDDFANATIMVRTARSAMHILRDGQAREQAAGRRRKIKWGPRTLDVDIIACQQGSGDDAQEVTSDTDVLRLPHPWASQRAFVLLPWLDIAPEATLQGTPVADLLARCDPTDRDGMSPWDDTADTTAHPDTTGTVAAPRGHNGEAE